MNRKPDVIRSLVIIFMMGLVVSGFTNLGASEGPASAQLPAAPQPEVSETPAWRLDQPQ